MLFGKTNKNNSYFLLSSKLNRNNHINSLDTNHDYAVIERIRMIKFAKNNLSHERRRYHCIGWNGQYYLAL